MNGRRGPVALAAGAVVGVLVTAGCSGAETEDPPPSSTPGSTAPSTSVPTPPPRATPVPKPAAAACYRLTYAQAVSPTTRGRPVGCRQPHTSETFRVAGLDNIVDGHLLAVDSDRVQEKVASACPAALGEAVGGSPDDVRLSMLRAVWFTPTLAQAQAGASWYRCDVVALAGRDRLAPVTGSLAGVLDEGPSRGRDRWGMCGTASPDSRDFERVPCGRRHSWRAFDVVDLPDGDYPGPAAVTDAGADPCENAAAGIADDPLDYEWAFEGPDAAQWAAGQTYVRCWTPD